MIIDCLKNASLYYGMSEKFAAAFNYLKNADLSNINQGKHEIDGSNIYALVQRYMTKPRENGFWEAHRRYIDIQYVVKGVELIGYANLDNLKAGEYDEEKDFLPLQGDGDFIVVQAGTFVIFMPQDAHMPCLTVTTPQAVEKIVLKVCVTSE